MIVLPVLFLVFSAAQEANTATNRNAEAAALSAVESALRSKPGDYDLLVQRGRIYRGSGDQVHAIESFLLAAKSKPTSDVFYDIGLSFFLIHEYERAGRHFLHATQLDPRNHKAEFMLAAIGVLKDNDEGAAKVHLEKALAIEPENPHYLLHYGIVLLERNDPKGAGNALGKAAKLDPSNPLAHFNLGRYFRQTGEMTKARSELETAVRLRPALARAHYQLAAVYRALGEGAKAKQATEQYLKFKDQDRDDDPVGSPPSYLFKDQPTK